MNMKDSSELKEFSKGVAEKLKCYVYKLIDPRNGQVFYIGKGTGNRVFQHMRGEGLKDKSEHDDRDEKENVLPLKIETIREINRKGLDVIAIIHRHGMTSEEALLVEAALIDEYSGLLANIQVGKGSSDYGPRSVIQINNDYSREVLEEIDKEEKALIIKINNDSIENNEDNIYEATRKYWIIGEKRNKVKKVLAVNNGIVIAEYNNIKWEKSKEQDKRYFFTGEEEKKPKYIGKIIPEKYRRKGIANPILYCF